MSISVEELRQMAELARLKLSDRELEAMHSDLNRVLAHFRSLQALDLSGVEVAPHAVDVEGIWAEDEPRDTLPRSKALSGAPQSEAGLFLVPTIIE